MKPRCLVVVLAACVLAGAAPTSGRTASKTVRLTIAHVVAHCHVWETTKRTFGPTLKLTVARGTRVVIRPDCPMDFDFVQTKGPKLTLGDLRTYAGTARTITFRNSGSYRLTVTNVQTPEERGLTVLGGANTLTLTIHVR